MGNPKEAVENKIENKTNIFDNEFGLHDGDDLSQKNHEISLSKLDEKDDKIITNDWNKTNSANNEEEINSNRKEFNKDKLGKNFYNVAEDDASKILKELDDEKEINLNQKELIKIKSGGRNEHLKEYQEEINSDRNELNKVKSGGKNEHLKEYQEEINSDRKELNKDKSGEKNEHVKEYQEEINPDRKELKKDKPTKNIENSKDQSVAEDDILEILKKLDDEVNANKKVASDTKDTPAKKNGSVNDIDNKVEENEKIDKEENIVLNSSDTNKYLKADKESGKTNSKDVLRNRKLDTEKIKDQPQNAADNNVDTLEINEKLEDDSKNVALDTISKDQYNAENIENKVEEKETYFVEDNINDKVDNANAKKNKKMTANDNDEPQLNDFSEDSNIANKEINPDNIVEKEAPVDDMYDDEDDGKLGTKENKLKDDEKNTKDDDQDINGDEQDITDDDQKLNNDKENNTKPDDAVNQNNIDDYSQDAGEYLDNELRSKTKTKKNKNSRKRKKQVTNILFFVIVCLFYLS